MKEHEGRHPIWESAKSDLVEPRPYARTRALALHAERVRARKQRNWLFTWAVASSAAVVVLSFGTVFQFGARSTPSLQAMRAPVGAPVSVRIEIEAVRDPAVAFASVVLPDGVSFNLPADSPFYNERTLEFQWEKISDLKQIPLVVKAKNSGFRSISVRFLNAQRELVFEKSVLVEFKGDAA